MPSVMIWSPLLPSFSSFSFLPIAADNASLSDVPVKVLFVRTMPATVGLALSISWLCVLLTAALVDVAVILDGVPKANVRLPASVPPPVNPAPAASWIVLSAFCVSVRSAAALYSASVFFSQRVRSKRTRNVRFMGAFGPPITLSPGITMRPVSGKRDCSSKLLIMRLQNCKSRQILMYRPI